MNCFNDEMHKHIIANFNYPKRALNRGIEGKLDVSFIIDTSGQVKDVIVIGNKEHEILKKEARRIVSLLPKFVAGKHKGVNRKVFYSFPISFSLE